jgi:hypothetical protein
MTILRNLRYVDWTFSSTAESATALLLIVAIAVAVIAR